VRQPQRRIWKNGKLLPESEAVQSLYDSGSMYGDSTFSMLRSFNKETFKLDAHINRILDACKFLQLDCPYNFYQLRQAHFDLINANRNEFAADDEYRTFINVSRGPLPIYSEILTCQPIVTITIYPLRWVLRGQSKFYTTGRPAVITSQRAIPSRYLENKVKHHCRLSSRMAELEAKRSDPDAWPLLTGDDGFITEGTGANFFIVKRDRLFTSETKDCLRGISRNFIFGLARQYDIDCRERIFDAYDAITADEGFYTATPFCIMPCTRINGQEIGKGKVGPMTKFLTAKWIEAVKCDFVEQARKWDEN